MALDRERATVRPARRLLLLAPTGVLLLAALLPVSFSTPFPLCAIKALTCGDCPGCGMTRAFLLIGAIDIHWPTTSQWRPASTSRYAS